MDKYLQNQIKEHEQILVKLYAEHNTSHEEIMKLLFRQKDIPTDILKEIMVLDTLKKTWNREKHSDEGSLKYYLDDIIKELQAFSRSINQEEVDKLKTYFHQTMPTWTEIPDTAGIIKSSFTQLLQAIVLKGIYATERSKQSGLSEQPTSPEDNPEPPKEVA